MIFLVYSLNKKTKNYSEGSFSITSINFYRSLRLSSPGRHEFMAVIISFLFDCLLNVFNRDFGYIFGSCEYLFALLSKRLGDYLKIVPFPLLLSKRYSELMVLGVW